MKTIIIGLSGPMASGKNFVSSILERHGCISIDADKLAHIAIEQNKDTILKEFYSEAKEKNICLFNPDNSINRKELAKIVFSSAENIKKQENIIHPIVNEMMEEFISKHPNQTIILNATVLYKTPIINKCDALILVSSPILLRFIRAKKREKITFKQIISRFLSQFNIFAKYKFFNTDIYKVRNYISEDKLENKVIQVLNKIYSKQGH